ncbi:unnamed protein product [Gongylonema pulchrum]|uniref:Uncharacterized protein n=1 Tax=Gongylonema pulchrum TaxID=637853 RepID=A0A183F1J9_9BILA|nr:unnamed protein product [Gongylonema pulchrum]
MEGTRVLVRNGKGLELFCLAPSLPQRSKPPSLSHRSSALDLAGPCFLCPGLIRMKPDIKDRDFMYRLIIGSVCCPGIYASDLPVHMGIELQVKQRNNRL